MLLQWETSWLKWLQSAEDATFLLKTSRVVAIILKIETMANLIQHSANVVGVEFQSGSLLVILAEVGVEDDVKKPPQMRPRKSGWAKNGGFQQL
ncbi:hypothetical protein N8Z37_05130 [Octadecabacter sp.]|nr:hypothetical protein [Octadecabacter sp.]